MATHVGFSGTALRVIGASALVMLAGCTDSGSGGTGGPASLPIPAGCTFAVDASVGEACPEDLYVTPVSSATCAGCLACYDGAWAYSTYVPSSSLYVPDEDGGDDASDAADAETDAASDDAGNNASDAGDAG